MARKVLSPHLTVYAPQVTALFSIFHRISGGVLGLGFLITMMWPLIRMCYLIDPTLSPYLQMFEPYLVLFMQALGGILLWSVCYHFSNGIRHMIWDMGLGFSNQMVKTTAGMALGLALILYGIALYSLIYVVDLNGLSSIFSILFF
jgi:succinate dehydrogenase / fumarate reductase cytochrome b subunit